MAAGWFVKTITSDYLAVVATSVATKHAATGEGQATAHLGLRVESVEQTVSQLLGLKYEGYRSRTATTPLGHATGQNRWLEWPISQAEVEQVASAVAALIADKGWQYLGRLADDADFLLAAIKASASFDQSIGFARTVVLLGRLGRRDEARRVIEERQQQVEGRSDAAAQDAQRAADVLLPWLHDNRKVPLCDPSTMIRSAGCATQR